jgi:hypothetical protein
MLTRPISIADLPLVPSQLLPLNGGATQRVTNPQFTTLNMAPYNRPQTQPFGLRSGSLQRDPSRKTLRAAEPVSSITGVRTMTALGPSLQNKPFQYRRTSYSQAEELLKRKALNSRQMKRIIITS